MAKDKYSGEVVKSLGYHNYLVYKDPIDYILSQKRSLGQKGASSETGRADLVALKNGMGAAIEIKNGKDGLNLDKWTEKQRKWARDCEERMGVPYYIWLLLGSDPPNRNAERFNPRKSWLVPRSEFIRIENIIREYQKTLVYRAGKGMNLEIQSKKLDAINLLKSHELSWQGDGIWLLGPKEKV